MPKLGIRQVLGYWAGEDEAVFLVLWQDHRKTWERASNINCAETIRSFYEKAIRRASSEVEQQRRKMAEATILSIDVCSITDPNAKICAGDPGKEAATSQEESDSCDSRRNEVLVTPLIEEASLTIPIEEVSPSALPPEEMTLAISAEETPPTVLVEEEAPRSVLAEETASVASAERGLAAAPGIGISEPGSPNIKPPQRGLMGTAIDITKRLFIHPWQLKSTRDLGSSKPLDQGARLVVQATETPCPPALIYGKINLVVNRALKVSCSVKPLSRVFPYIYRDFVCERLESFYSFCAILSSLRQTRKHGFMNISELVGVPEDEERLARLTKSLARRGFVMVDESAPSYTSFITPNLNLLMGFGDGSRLRFVQVRKTDLGKAPPCNENQATASELPVGGTGPQAEEPGARGLCSPQASPGPDTGQPGFSALQSSPYGSEDAERGPGFRSRQGAYRTRPRAFPRNTGIHGKSVQSGEVGHCPGTLRPSPRQQ